MNMCLIRRVFLGKHIRLVDRKWAIAVEQAIGNVIPGFLCSCREDERLFLEILSRCVPAQDMDYRPSITGKEFFCSFDHFSFLLFDSHEISITSLSKTSSKYLFVTH
jgi:hypothetical protein